MGFVNKQIGWSNESNLLQYILKQLVKLTAVVSKISSGGGGTPYTPPYKVYSALLNQDLTKDPEAIVLENTLGSTIVWSRKNSGEYRATISGLFTNNKTMIQISTNTGQGDTVVFSVTDINTIELGTANSSFTLADNLLDNTPIEIRVYN